jgi:hypothetical protein
MTKKESTAKVIREVIPEKKVSKADNDLLHTISFSLAYKLVQLSNGQYRVAHKTRVWASPELKYSEAVVLTNQLNRKAPENRKTIFKTGIWNED